MALFDVVVNNADRKGGHVLPMPDGHRHGVDHGLTFHVEHKLRTVLWGWVGERDQRRGDRRPARGSRRRSTASWARRCAGLLTDDEVEATRRRVARLLARGRFPVPRVVVVPGHPLAALLRSRADAPRRIGCATCVPGRRPTFPDCP